MAGAIDGFSVLERGIPIHAAIAAFWRDVKDHETLVVLPRDELLRRIEMALAQPPVRVAGPLEPAPVVAAGDRCASRRPSRHG